ncbi:MAG: radical SAM protein [Candidatus Omnitrophica bacterium]|nr:radical SAM protein [Candidatus Omnitrophota bacterium]
MRKKKFRHIYGPVSSWRLGSSLGVDPVYRGKQKVCSFDCIYCQIGRTHVLTGKRKIYIPTAKITREIASLPPVKIDYITFSGAGEPTLAENLGEIIKKIRKIRKEKIAVITNSSLMDKKDVRKDLSLADFVIAKLDAHFKELFKEIARSAKTIRFDKIIKGLKKFSSTYKKKLALQIMFIKANKDYAEEIADLAARIAPDEIQINTPLRPSDIKALSKKEIQKIKKQFAARCGKKINIISVYDAKKKKVKSLSGRATLKRRGKV